MLVDKKTIDYVASLSRLRLNDEQAALMQCELGKILDYMEILKKVDVSGVEPLSHVFSMTNVTRPDVVSEHFDRDFLLQNASEKTFEAFVVPKAVDV